MATKHTQNNTTQHNTTQHNTTHHTTTQRHQVPELAGKDPLILSLQTVAEIYLGHISHWNDAAIAEMNPHLRDVLPMQPIMVVCDGVGSEMTYQLSKTLSAFAAEFNSTVRRRRAALSLLHASMRERPLQKKKPHQHNTQYIYIYTYGYNYKYT